MMFLEGAPLLITRSFLLFVFPLFLAIVTFIFEYIEAKAPNSTLFQSSGYRPVNKDLNRETRNLCKKEKSKAPSPLLIPVSSRFELLGEV